MICERCEGIKPFIVMDVLERAQEMERAGQSVIHLEVGEPDFDTPQAIKHAAVAALERGETHYTHSLGIMELREAVCEHYRQTYGIDRLTPERVVITSGTSPGFLMAFSAVVEPGDEVILSDPHYACYPNFVKFLGGGVRRVPTPERDGFQFRADGIREALSPKTRAVLINSPSNPTGNLLNGDRMAEIAELPPWIFSDEIYHGLVYEGRAHSMLEFTDRCVIFNGFSKLYAMTGWRLGYLIVPPEWTRAVQKMMQNFFISANACVQRAGCTALTDHSVAEDVERMRATYDERRRFMISRLREIGFGITVEPTGAFYVFANAGRFAEDSYRFAFEILENARVGVTPGVDFGPGGEGYLRFSYANSLDNIAEGLDRIEAYLRYRNAV